jgi:hypothetical protein
MVVKIGGLGRMIAVRDRLRDFGLYRILRSMNRSVVCWHD